MNDYKYVSMNNNEVFCYKCNKNLKDEKDYTHIDDKNICNSCFSKIENNINLVDLKNEVDVIKMEMNVLGRKYKDQEELLEEKSVRIYRLIRELIED